MEILQIENLTFSYPEASRPAIKDLSLSVNSGEFIVVCGETGCGKSTLLKLIKKEVSPYGDLKGSIVYKNTPIEKLSQRISASELGFIFQNPESQIVTDYVWHELAFGLENLGYDNGVIRRRVAEISGYFGIEEWFNKNTNELSGGQKQLLNLACVMVMQPDILLLDEPTAQLDPIAASNFINTLQKLNRDLGLTVILVEHRLEDVFPIADKVLLMDGGEGVYFGNPKGINKFFKKNPTHPMVSSLPSATRIFNMLECEGEAPLSVRDGNKYITNHYRNEYTSVEQETYVSSEDKVVELKNVCFRFEKDLPDVVRNLNLSAFRGEHLCILGGNGVGKTTLLNLISGVLKAYRGKIFINGKKIESYKGGSLYIDNIAALPQNPQTLFLSKTVIEDLEEVCSLLQYTKADSDRLINENLKKLGISHLAKNHPYDLSGGEQQKAALAKILLTKPKILLLDEPTKAIDSGSKATLKQIIDELKSENVAVLTVTHDIEFAASSADRCAFLFNGEVISVDTPDKFFSENNFYTTAACRISHGFFKNTILCEQVAKLCRINGEKDGGTFE